ncbi:amidohydrolase family protein [candidate division KSB1 bacterium]|nr:amidohydrolase family protein [candidate division KSB1 bacterium]
MEDNKVNRRKFLKWGMTTGAVASTAGAFSGPVFSGAPMGIQNKENFNAILEYVSSLPAFSDHNHHNDDDFFRKPMTLDRAINSTYVGISARYRTDGTQKARQALLDNVRFNSYFHWFEKGLQYVHGIDEPITMENWEKISDIIRKAYASDSDFHWKALKKNGFQKIIIDLSIAPGENHGHDEIFTAAFRIDQLMYGHHAEVVYYRDLNPWKYFGFGGGTLDDYVRHIQEIIRDRVQSGKVVALKCAEAYRRDIEFYPDDKVAAQNAFGMHPDRISPEQRRLFSNYMFNRCCEIAAELDIPLQVHTGLAKLDWSHPMKLLPLIKRHRKTRFVLFHSGYPWTNDTCGLLHNHPNVIPNLTWTVNTATSEAIRVLHDYIDVAPSINTITWGDDCWIAEESVGTLLAWQFVVAKVLSDRLSDGRLNVKDAELLARKLMYENGQNVYLKK